MPNYKKMYLHLFNAATDAIRLLDKGDGNAAKEHLILAQQEAEEMFISEPERFSELGLKILPGGKE